MTADAMVRSKQLNGPQGQGWDAQSMSDKLTTSQDIALIRALSAELFCRNRYLSGPFRWRKEWLTDPDQVHGVHIGTGRHGSIARPVFRTLQDQGLLTFGRSQTAVPTRAGRESVLKILQRTGWDGMEWCLDKDNYKSDNPSPSRRGLSDKDGYPTKKADAILELVRRLARCAPSLYAITPLWWDVDDSAPPRPASPPPPPSCAHSPEWPVVQPWGTVACV